MAARLCHSEGFTSVEIAKNGLPVRHIAFSSTGSAIAAGGDDSEVKIINIMDKSAKVLRGHDGAIRSLTYDPEGDMIASASTDGTVKIWQLMDDTCVKTLSLLNNGDDSTLKIDWHPNGKVIAVPVSRKVEVYERDSWDLLYSFGGDEGHGKDVSLASWSPNGEFLASVSISGEIIVWETQTRQSLGRFKHKEGVQITSMSWDPAGNRIAWADVLGKFGVWNEPVPDASQFAKPIGGDKNAADEAKAQELSELFGDDDDDDIGKSRKKLKKKVKPVTVHVDSDDEIDGTGIEMSDDRAFIEDDTLDDDRYGVPRGMELTNRQLPFQPSSTPKVEGSNRRILVWNGVGIICSREDDLSSSVDVEFHNKAKHKPIRMTDHFGFNLAAMAEHAFVMAAPAVSNGTRENPAVLFCRNINHWASDETWICHIQDGEEIDALAICGGARGFVAAATNKMYVRLFSMNGVAKHVFSLDGPVVSMSAKDEQLLVVYHMGAGAEGDQSMGYLLLDVDSQKMIAKDRLPLSVGSELAWLGFSDSGMPAFADTEEVVRVMVQEWGNLWSPILEFKSTLDIKKRDRRHWIVAVTDSDVMCVVCKGGATFPPVLPRAIVSTVALQMPIVSLSDTMKMEESFLRSKINFDHLVRIEDLDDTDVDDHALMQRAQQKMDQHLIHCISRAVQTQKPGRALDLTTSLSLVKSVDVAIRLAVKAKLPQLAERMTIAKHALVEAKVEAREAAYLTPAQISVSRTPASSVRQRPAYTNSNETPTTTQRGRPLHANREEPAQSSMAGNNTDEDEVPVMKAANTTSAPSVKDESDNDDDEDVEDIVMPIRKNTEKPSAPKKSAVLKNPFATSVKPATTVTPSLSPGEAAPYKQGQKRQLEGMFLEQSKPIINGNPTKESEIEAKKIAKAEAKDALEQKAKRRKKDPNFPKKPMSAYFMWMAAERSNIKAKFPDLHPKELVKKCGELWNEEEEIKAKWTATYLKAKSDFDVAVKEYEIKYEGREADASCVVEDTLPCSEAMATQKHETLKTEEGAENEDVGIDKCQIKQQLESTEAGKTEAVQEELTADAN